jgi:uncharacterized iron-regulated protein
MSLMKKLILVLLVCLPATAWSANLHYVLDVKIDPTEKKIRGIARLKADVSKKIGLSVRNLRKLKVDGKSITAPADEGIILVVKSGEETLISFEAQFVDRGINFIDDNNVFLTGAWYPQPDVLAEYGLSVTLPKDFLATSEAEAVRVQNQGDKKTFHFQFKHPLDALHLAASTRYVLKKGRYNNIAIEAFFFKEDAQLADTYIAHAQKYLKMYETMLTPYPYKRFAIVENILPTGNSMPTYTLLGSRVVHLPFIVKTSLGHEILHQWFGNSVYIDFAHGNWAEGITTYLADHHYAALEGKDAAYRKQIMVNYNAYVNTGNAMRMSDFYNRRNRAQSAIGYGKVAMLFHWLRKGYGDKAFFTALREFIQQNEFRKASWHDIQRAFEKVTGEKLYKDFGDWLTRKDIPRLSVEDVELQVEKGQLKLNFTLFKQDAAYGLRMPVTIYTERGKTKRSVEVKDLKENISLTLDEPPTKVVIDENYSLMRQLTPEETPPVLASIMGKEKLTAVVTDEHRALYQPIIDSLGVKNIIYVAPDAITFTEMKGNTFLIAGYDNSLVDMLFGKQVVPEEGVYLKVCKNPYNIAERIMLLHAKNLAEAQDVRRKIPHYGKYTELAFNNGRNTHKAIAETDNGISLLTRPATRALRPDKIATLSEILPKLSESSIIYVGERHDQFAHHFNQLQIIKKLHEAGHKLAVGMEMFQRTQQQTLDDYLAGRIDEHTFLEKTEYFDKWGYDYNLYKPIIDYLKQQKIPLVALNIERDITRKVAREGMYSLTDEEKKRIPSALDFSNKEYRDDLNKVFSLHADHGDFRDFNYFLQSQTLWDEGMAESAHQFMARNPECKMVILTGNGHIRHTYGIPERLYRRNHEPFTIVVQDEEIEYGIADYVLLSTELKGRESPKLGVLVVEKDQGLTVMGARDNTPARKAGLQKGDIIIQFAGQPIRSLADLKRALFFSEMGSTLEIQLKRNDKTLDKEIELFDFD